MNEQIAIPINNEMDIVLARQKGREMARDYGFATLDCALIATGISELTRNIISYAVSGTLYLELIEEKGRRGILVIAQDTGPGIVNIDLAMQDGYSTANSLGYGLPGVKRLMDDFTIQSNVGSGTTIKTKKWMS